MELSLILMTYLWKLVVQTSLDPFWRDSCSPKETNLHALASERSLKGWFGVKAGNSKLGWSFTRVGMEDLGKLS